MDSSTNKEIIEQIDQWVQKASALIKAETYSDDEIPVRRWKGDGLAQAIGVSTQRIYLAEKNGQLPANYKDVRNEEGGYTLPMILEAKRVFGTLPGRNDEIDEAVIISFTNFKGGCYKTLTALNVAACAGTDGLRVLLVDLDPQASATRNMGLQPDVSVHVDDTLAPLIEGAEEVNYESVKRRVQTSGRIPTLDLLPASLDLQASEWILVSGVNNVKSLALPDHEKAAARTGYFLRVAECLEEVKDDYDLIILDGTPTLGIIPLNIVFSSHEVIVPTPTEMVDFASTRSFLKLLSDQLTVVEENFPGELEFPQISFLPTRFGGINTTASRTVLETFIKPAFGSAVMRNVIRKHDSAIGASNVYCRTVFEVNKLPDVRKDALERCIANYTSVYEEILYEMVYPRWPSKQAEMEMRGMA